MQTKIRIKKNFEKYNPLATFSLKNKDELRLLLSKYLGISISN